MKLIESIGPNPRLVRMYLAEKGIEIPTEEIDILGGANRQPGYTDRNPFGQLPSLELDDGTVIAETTVICEYLEEKHPDPPLVGTTAEGRAFTRSNHAFRFLSSGSRGWPTPAKKSRSA